MLFCTPFKRISFADTASFHYRGSGLPVDWKEIWSEVNKLAWDAYVNFLVFGWARLVSLFLFIPLLVPISLTFSGRFQLHVT